MSAPPMYNDQKPPPYVQQPQPQQAYMAPPPTGPYIQQQPAVGQSTVLITNYRPMPTLSLSPQSLQCPHCHAEIVTRVDHKSGLLTWLICGAICFFGGIFGCCLIPFCIDDLKDVEHFCPSCNHFLGIRRRMG